MFIPGRIFAPGDLAATAEPVRANALPLRVPVVAEIWQCLFLVFAAIAIYQLLREVDQTSRL